MVSQYWTWVIWSTGISCGILLLTLFILWLILRENDAIFYAIVDQLLNIKRCYIDAHHNIIEKDNHLNLRSMMENMIGEGISLAATHGIIPGAIVKTEQPSEDDESKQHTVEKPDAIVKTEQPSKDDKNKQHTVEKPASNSEYQREVLNVYGKYISVRKRGTLFFVMTLTTIIIAGALIAAFNALFLATITVYDSGPCPVIGPMECFCGPNATFFACDTGKTNACPFYAHASSCFRWIARDLTTSDITTQLGVTTGLLLAFGNITQAVIRIYLLAFNKRLSIATGIHRIAAKTIGINRFTANTRCCCCNLPWHCSPCNLGVYKHPSAMIIITIIYIAIPALMFPAVALLYYYELSVTSLTFIVLIVIAIICIVSIVWIMVQESEASSNIPGGWSDVKMLIQTIKDNGKASGGFNKN